MLGFDLGLLHISTSMQKTLIPKFTYINRSYNPYNDRLSIDNIISRNLFIYIFYCLCVRNPLNT
ncbi:hypothetical protein HanRHA438_Chr02g0085841 [Helianthus annuus]|nr:hypothetical protein HanRHA438_Chr02g0085841 [Helianthus annuus]